MLSFIDGFIDRITMYRLILYYLAVLWGAAFLLGLFRLIDIDPTALAFSLVVVTVVCWTANWVFARVFNAIANVESVFITALILVLILDPVTAKDLNGLGVLVLASIWAVASKFIVSLRRRHIFNPAAFGVVLPALLLDAPASWWISGERYLLPLVFVGGLLLVRKLRRIDLVLAFAIANIGALLATSAPSEYPTQLQFTLLNSPFFFFAFVMLTEPLTAPQSTGWRIAYGALVGVLASPNIHVGPYYFTPEIALLIGNLLTLAVSPAGRLTLTLERIEHAAAGAYDYVFRPDRPLAFTAGQYLEWTLPVEHPDNRGNRRYFTLASAPTEGEIRLGVKFAGTASAFKRELAGLRPGERLVASQLAGNFTLPKDPARKLVFIAGGIGITPFRSMLKYLLDKNERRPIVVLYGNRSEDEVAYSDLLAKAESQLDIPTFHAVMEAENATPRIKIGVIDEAMIRRTVPDYRERTFYISGPQTMVSAMRRLLRRMGVPPWRIKTDFFPGLA